MQLANSANPAKGNPTSVLLSVGISARPLGLCVTYIGAEDPNPRVVVGMQYWVKNGLQEDPNGGVGAV